MNKNRYTTFDLICLTNMAVLMVATKVVLRIPLKMSGKSGLFMIPILLVACHIVPKRWSATFVSIIGAVIVSFLGHGEGLLFTVIRWACRGLAIDLVCDLFKRRGTAAECILAGILGALVKSVTRFGLLMLAGATGAGTLAIMAIDMQLHAIFGAGGAIIGLLLLRALKQAGLFAYLAERTGPEQSIEPT